MARKMETLGKFITQLDYRARNSKNTFSLFDISGISSISKEFTKTKANLVDVTVDSYKICPPNCFAYNPNTARMGDKIPIALNKTSKDVLVSSIYPVFKIDETKILSEYLLLFFKREEFDRYARYMSTGSAREIFDWNEMCRVELPVPDLTEQQRIVNAYNIIEHHIKILQQINVKTEKQIRCLYKESLKNTMIEKLKLSTLCSKIGSGATPRGGKSTYINSGISFIRSMNVFDYNFEENELAHITEQQAKELENVTVQEDDVLFNITGVSVARCCILPKEILPARVNQHVLILRPKNKNLNLFLMCSLCDTDNKNLLLGISQSGSTREAINKQEMENFEISVPNNETLEEFNRKCKPIQKYRENIKKEISELEQLKQLLISSMTGM